jgi:signal transduction histidine kinase
MKDQTGLRRISIILFVAMLLMLVIHVQILVTFNRQEVTVHGNDSGSKAYMEIDPRGNSTSRWLKRDYPLTEEETVDLIGETIDQTLYNNSGDNIESWGLRINITGDCFINQAWTGEVEIHQAGDDGEETVQRLNLQDYVLNDLKLRYRYDGDLLIPLRQGDYILYIPSEPNTEMTVRAGEKVTIGMIFYHLDNLNLSDYDLTVRFHRGFAQGWSFFAFIGTVVLCVLASVMYGTSVYIYRNEQKQMKLRRAGMNYMSELYEAIYIINLPTGEVTPVSPGDYLEELREKYAGAKELLQAAVKGDAEESYLDETLAFVDTDTLAERLKDRESMVYEFVSAVYGWCRFRFFAMDRTEGKPLENVIFAVQDINDERSAAKGLADRLKKAESATTASNAFMAGAARDLRAPVKEVLELDEKILSESDPEKVRGYAEGIRGTAERMLTLISGLADRARAEDGTGAPVTTCYSLKKLTTEALEAVRLLAEEKGIALETEIPENVPDALSGDADKLREVITSLLDDAVRHSADGSVRLFVFAKAGKGTVHLLVSVRSLPAGGKPSEALPNRETDPDLDLEVAGSLLACMGSGLKTVRSADAWKDVYFEIDQTVAEGTER